MYPLKLGKLTFSLFVHLPYVRIDYRQHYKSSRVLSKKRLKRGVKLSPVVIHGTIIYRLRYSYIIDKSCKMLTNWIIWITISQRNISNSLTCCVLYQVTQNWFEIWALTFDFLTDRSSSSFRLAMSRNLEESTDAILPRSVIRENVHNISWI